MSARWLLPFLLAACTPRVAPPELPGAPPLSAELNERLQAALVAKGVGYEPRTKHKDPNGSPRYTNRLILATSPYLLQHAHNPVSWFPWGEEAFALAAALDRPVLLSVGYATCHWCHVMEEESFEDLEIAEALNRLFVCIKVDREERPDVDGIYMTAVNLLAGRGGWPMTIVMTPERQPFFAGTYFPPRDGDRGARRGFLGIARELAERYRSERPALLAQAREVSARLVRASEPAPPASVPGLDAADAAVAVLARGFDAQHGGFGDAPKFPRPATLELLARVYRRTRDPSVRAMLERTLLAMARGGMNDQIGGGFHRYATDAEWRVPHFEKMLYDNAQLAIAYLEGWQLLGRDDLAGVARATLDYLQREMTAPEGGLWSATDADSPAPSGRREEGWFFTWTPAELDAALGPDSGSVAARAFGVTGAGNLDGRSVLWLPSDPPDRAIAARLYEIRRGRAPPLTDTKIVAAWNGLALSAFARGARVLDAPAYGESARRAARFVLERLWDGTTLHRTWAAGAVSGPGFLDDYAGVVAGLLDLFELDAEPRWLEAALAIQDALDRDFGDPAGGYWLSSGKHEALLAREKPDYDGAEPAGNSVAAMNLLRLHVLTGRAELRARADATLAAFARVMTTRPESVPKMLAALELAHARPREVLIVKPEAGSDAAPLLAVFRQRFLPHASVLVTVASELPRLTRVVPWAESKTPRDGRPTAYVCERGVCELPTTDPVVFAEQLERTYTQ